MRADIGHAIDWEGIYFDLVGEQGIWDFRDLFLSSLAFYGETETFLLFFGSNHPLEVVDAIVKDWSPADDDEASTTAMLDLFSSWILEQPSDHVRSLLFDHARALAASVERTDPGLMMSGPFIRWLLAKTAVEMPIHLVQGPDGMFLKDFGGREVLLSLRMDLPVYVPTQHNKRPPWAFFFRRSTPEQRRVAEVAAGAAHQLGDYNLQAAALKLLILQSEDPRDLMDTLAHLQLEVQGDKEGYIATCLSRYLVITGPAEEAELLQRLEKPGLGAGTFDFEHCHNASLVWAWSVIRIMLRCSSMERESGTNGNGRQDASFVAQFAEKGIRMNEWKLSPCIVKFSQQKLGIGIHESPRTGPSPPLVYGRNMVAQPGAGPQSGRMSPESRYVAAMGTEIPPLSVRSRWPPPHSQTSTAPLARGDRHQDRPGGSNTGAPSVQTQQRQSSRERVRGRLCLEDVNAEGDKSQAASSKREKKRKAGKEKREEAKVTWKDETDSFVEAQQQQPSQGRGCGTLSDEAGATESRGSRRKDEDGEAQLDKMVGSDGRSITLKDRPALKSAEPRDAAKRASTEQEVEHRAETNSPLNNTNPRTTKSKDDGGRKTGKWNEAGPALPMLPRQGPVYRGGLDAESQLHEDRGYSSSYSSASSSSSPSDDGPIAEEIDDGPVVEEIEYD